ncbi:MAG: hypothetical protein KDD62_11245, partial [Bdellovibrionales bacterium]|nr:hypothetical protein [Bdellovibrionales bacterium]
MILYYLRYPVLSFFLLSSVSYAEVSTKYVIDSLHTCQSGLIYREGVSLSENEARSLISSAEAKFRRLDKKLQRIKMKLKKLKQQRANYKREKYNRKRKAISNKRKSTAEVKETQQLLSQRLALCSDLNVSLEESILENGYTLQKISTGLTALDAEVKRINNTGSAIFRIGDTPFKLSEGELHEVCASSFLTDDCRAGAINNLGHIAGDYADPYDFGPPNVLGPFGRRAFVLIDGSPRLLKNSLSSAHVHSLTDSGIVVGQYTASWFKHYRYIGSFVWNQNQTNYESYNTGGAANEEITDPASIEAVTSVVPDMGEFISLEARLDELAFDVAITEDGQLSSNTLSTFKYISSESGE